MKNVKKVICAALIIAVSQVAVGCSMISKTPEAIKNSAVATVNGTKITKAQFDNKMKAIITSLKSQYGTDIEKTDEGKKLIENQKTQVLDELILEEVLLQKANEKKLVPSKAELNKEIDKNLADIKKNLGTDDQYKAALKQAGYTEATLRDYLKQNVIINKVKDYATKSVTVSDDKVKQEYDENPFKYTEKTNTSHLQHILVKTEEEATQAKARIDKGEKFEDVAKAVSTDTATKDKGGDLGDIPYVDSGLDADFMKAAVKLGQGAVSGPVKTQFGYHLIKCVSKTEYPPKKFDAVKDDIKKTLLDTAKNDAFTKAYTKWKKDAKIEKFTKNM